MCEFSPASHPDVAMGHARGSPQATQITRADSRVEQRARSPGKFHSLHRSPSTRGWQMFSVSGHSVSAKTIQCRPLPSKALEAGLGSG